MSPAFLTEPIPHTEAADLIRNKPVMTREVFDQLPAEMKCRALTITGIENFDVMQAVQDELAKLPAGADWKKVRKEIAAKISPWLGEEEGLRRAKLLLNHHGRAAYAATNARVVHGQADVFTHLMYRSSRISKEPRGSHRALDGLILPTAHPFWNTHTPPWEFGCNCMDPIPLTQEDADDAEREKPGSVATAAQQKALQDGTLVKGVETYDIQTPLQKSGGAAGYQWSWKDTTLPYQEIKKRWEPAVAAKFEEWAEKQDVNGASLLQWLVPSPAAQAGKAATLGDFLAAAPAASTLPTDLAALLRAEPEHPVAKAIKLWGDDEERFTALMLEDTEEATAWRETMAATLSKLKPVAGAPVLYRGWSFKTADEKEEFLEKYAQVFIQQRTGMSGTFDLSVAARDKFSGGEHSMIWVVNGNRTAIDMRPAFEAVNAKAYQLGESEVIYPPGAILDWDQDKAEFMEITDSDGNARIIRVYYLTER